MNTRIAFLLIAIATTACEGDKFGGTLPDGGEGGDAAVDAPTGDASDLDVDPPADGGGGDAVTTADADASDATTALSKTVFVTSTTHDAAFGGASGADAICTTSAKNGGLSGAYKAWVSTTTSSPSTAFTHASVPYRLVDSTLVADNFAGLITNPLKHAINQNEFGTTISVQPVWTQTAADGTRSTGVPGCYDFTSNVLDTTEANTGSISKTDAGWTFMSQYTCDYKLALYCFEQ